MITKSSKKSMRGNKKLYLALLLILLLAVGGSLFAYAHHKSSPASSLRTDTTNHSPKQDVIDKSSSQPGTNGLPTDSTSKTTDQIPTNSALTVSISSFSQSNGMVQASAQTSGDGTCVFLYAPADGGKPVTLQATVSSNTCSASASQNEFVYLGQWKLTVTFYSNNSKAQATQDVTIH